MRERRGYHRMIAEWLVERSGERVNQYAATIAEHYERAQEPERAVEWYGLAGQQAREAYALATAIGFYRKALDFPLRACVYPETKQQVRSDYSGMQGS